ncbi:MAG TPA: ribonuclease Y [Candidatus Pacebacteria bacterium]|nr:ribonuclease Y [Candidatus Paceibacterota bacterium]
MAREAQAKAREIIVEAKDEALMIRSESERKARQQEQQLVEQQRSLEQKLDKLDEKLGQITSKEELVQRDKVELERQKLSVEDTKNQVIKKLEEVSGLTRNEAKKTLLENLEKKIRSESAQLIRQVQEETKQEVDEKVQEILIDAMKHGATEYVAEYTVSVVTIPNEEIKGKIIGKNGRNIHTFERFTGVDIDLDASPNEVKLSCFDPVRREIARVALERLIKDGRIQPARIEEVVEKVKTEMEKVTFEAGKNLCHAVGVFNVPTGLMQLLGRFKYRFSYGQNLVTHTIEETKIGTKLAHELGLNVNIVKLGCLLHDIGKVSEDQDDNHIALGVRIAKKFGLPQAVIDCIAQHHEDEPFSGPEQMAVYIADAISGARPGARYENLEEYVERLQSLEQIATSYPEVKEAYAVQAGREVRVLLEPEKSKDDDVTVLAVKIRDEIQEKVVVPGSVKVTVIRENRATEVAK